MNKHDFWFLSLVALFVFNICFSWPTPLRVAVIANSIIVLYDVIKQAWRLFYE